MLQHDSSGPLLSDFSFPGSALTAPSSRLQPPEVTDSPSFPTYSILCAMARVRNGLLGEHLSSSAPSVPFCEAFPVPDPCSSRMNPFFICVTGPCTYLHYCMCCSILQCIYIHFFHQTISLGDRDWPIYVLSTWQSTWYILNIQYIFIEVIN